MTKLKSASGNGPTTTSYAVAEDAAVCSTVRFSVTYMPASTSALLLVNLVMCRLGSTISMSVAADTLPYS